MTFSRKNLVLAHITFVLYMLLLFWVISLKCNMAVTISDTKIINAGTTVWERFQKYLSYNSFSAGWKDSVVNIIMFIPVGLLLPFVIKKHSYFNSIIWGMLISTAFEVLQIISCIGMFTYIDIINNTVGALIGVVLHSIFKRNAKEKPLAIAFVIHILFISAILVYATLNTINNIHLYL